MWYEEFEEENFEHLFERIIFQIKPLYVQLHAYVRGLIQKKYPVRKEKNGGIPKHFLNEIVIHAINRNFETNFFPYPEHDPVYYFDELLKKRNNRFTDSFNMAINYFDSMGMLPLKQEYFKHHTRVSRNNRSSFETCINECFDLDADVALRLCAKSNFYSLLKLHGDMSMMQYAMHKQKLPVPLNRQPCPGFALALAEATSLSVINFNYLQTIGMPKYYEFGRELHINMIFYLAVEILFPLMEHFVEDKLWLKIFEPGTKPQEYNCQYWLMLQEYAGVDPPEYRTDVHFDVSSMFYDVFEERPAAKMFSKVLGFHIYRELCKKSQPEMNAENDPGNCSFQGNRIIGKLLGKVMSLGSKRPWRSVLEVISGSKSFDASALVEFFEPLNKWLTTENKKESIHVGWKSMSKCDSVSSYFDDELFP